MIGQWWARLLTSWRISVSLGQDELPHWGRVTHINASKLNIIGSDNVVSLGRRQAIIWTNVGILLIGPLGTNSGEILIKTFSFGKMHLKMSFGKWRPFCFDLNLFQVIALCRLGDKSLPEPMMTQYIDACMRHQTFVSRQSIDVLSQLDTHWQIMTDSCSCHWAQIPHLTHWGRDKMAANFKTTFSNGSSLMKMFGFRLKFHWSYALSQHWFR